MRFHFLKQNLIRITVVLSLVTISAIILGQNQVTTLRSTEQALAFNPRKQNQLVNDYCEMYGWKPKPEGSRIPKVYDFFTLNTELMWLDIRLNELNSVVDKFVILESSWTFSGKKKPLHYKENAANFEKFNHKIVHIVADDDQGEKNAWHREYRQRNTLFTAGFNLTGIQEDDIIILSDIDEIPKPRAIRALQYCDTPKHVTLVSKFFYYSYEYRKYDWPHPQAARYHQGWNISAQDMRSDTSNSVSNAGWHCSYCFSKIGEYQNKLVAFSHQEYNSDEFKDPKTIVHRISKGKDFFGRKGGEKMSLVDRNDLDVPSYVLKNDSYSWMYNRHNPTGGFSEAELHSHGVKISKTQK